MNTNSVLGSTMGLSDLYPFAPFAPSGASPTAASGSATVNAPNVGNKPAISLVAIILILVAIRVLWEMSESKT
jgi:hypothetical protein